MYREHQITRAFRPLGKVVRDLGTRTLVSPLFADVFEVTLCISIGADSPRCCRSHALVAGARDREPQLERSRTLAGELIRYCEVHNKNLDRGRGRVRRSNLLMQDGEQFNIVGVSEAEPQKLIRAVLARWAFQENQFKYGVERLGINQLDGRRTWPCSA